jgi:hypothetical protein
MLEDYSCANCINLSALHFVGNKIIDGSGRFRLHYTTRKVGVRLTNSAL